MRSSGGREQIFISLQGLAETDDSVERPVVNNPLIISDVGPVAAAVQYVMLVTAKPRHNATNFFFSFLFSFF